MNTPKISLVIITKNEEGNIARCIRSAPWVDEIVVLDSESSDRTVEIASQMRAKVYVEPFRGFRAQKQRAVELASHDWILSLDADEELSEKLSQEIQERIRSKDFETFDGFDMPRLSFHLGRWIRHGGWYPDRQLRLFHRKRCFWGGGHLHERVEGKNVLPLKNDLRHFVFRDLAHQVDTNNRYSSLGAQDLMSRSKEFSILKLVFKPVSKFLETYVIKKGFLDGMAGFIISVSAAYSVFIKFAKVWEHQQVLSQKHLAGPPGSSRD